MSDRFFNIFGKVFLTLIVLSGMAYGGYYFGSQQKPKNNNQPQQANPTTIPTPTSLPWQSYSGGVSKSAGLSFDQYTISFPNEWSVKEENQTPLDQKLIIANNGYQISIFQAATGGALCLYDNDPDFEGPSSRFKSYKELTTQDARTLRRGGDLNGNAFTICQKSQDGSFGQPTNYGHISVKLPANWDQNILDEIDQIISSLKKS